MKPIRPLTFALTGALTLALLSACGPKGSTPSPSAPASPSPTATVSAAPPPSETTTVLSPEESDGGPALLPPQQSGEVIPLPPQQSAEVVPLSPSDTSVQSHPIVTPEPPPAEPETSKVQAAWSAIEAGAELPSLMDLDDELLASLYGISAADDLVTYIAKMPLMNVHATEFFLAQVKPDRMDAVKAAAEARQADLEAQWSQYLPDQLELVQNYQLVTSGDYILFCVCEDAAGAAAAFTGTVE